MINSSQQIKYGAIVSYIAMGINILIGLIYTPWMISSIGRENYGLFTLALSVINFFVFDFGLSAAVTRFLSKYLAEGRQDKADQCLGIVVRLYLYIDVFFLFALTAVYFFIPQIYQELTPEEIEKFKVIFIVVAVFTVISFPFIPVNGVLTANEKFVQLKTCDLAHKLIIVTAMSVCLLMGLGLYALVIVNAAAGIITIILKLIVIKRSTNANIVFGYRNRAQFKEILGFSVWDSIISICQRLIFTIAPTILGIFAGSVPIAIYGVASAIEGYVYSFSNVLSGMFLPKVSRIVAGDNNIMPLMIKVGRIQLMIVSAIVLGFICIGQDFIYLWLGEGFNESYICTVLLIIPSLFQLPQEIGMQTIVAQNKVKQQAILWIFMAVLNLGLAFLFTWKFGVVGIACSICIVQIFRTVGLDYIFVHYLQLKLRPFFRDTFGTMGLVLTVVLVLSLSSNFLLPSKSLVWFIIKITLFAIIFLAALYIVSNNEEKTLVKNLIRSVHQKRK